MGLFDRDYMRGGGARYFKPDTGMAMVWRLIWINVAVYLAIWVTTPAPVQVGGYLVQEPGKVFDFLALTTGGIRSLRVYQLVTAGFTHQDFWHIFLNMWGLYLFGSLVAPHIGGKRFLWLYLIGAVTGNLLFLAFNWNQPTILCGASGAVYGVMIAAAMLEPNRQFVMIFMPFWPIKTSTMVICFTVLELLQQVGGMGGNVAHLAHLGGFIGGYCYLKTLRGLSIGWDPMRWFRMPTPGGGANRAKPRYDATEYRRSDWAAPCSGTMPPRNPDAPVTQQELDKLLDKISEAGVNSLTPDELATLRRAREQMKRQGR